MNRPLRHVWLVISVLFALLFASTTYFQVIAQGRLNADGRNDGGPLLDNDTLKAGTYRLVFDVKGYFASKHVALPEPNFLNQVSLDFGVAHTDQHYHVPLLVSPWSYSTYRGS